MLLAVLLLLRVLVEDATSPTALASKDLRRLETALSPHDIQQNYRSLPQRTPTTYCVPGTTVPTCVPGVFQIGTLGSACSLSYTVHWRMFSPEGHTSWQLRSRGSSPQPTIHCTDCFDHYIRVNTHATKERCLLPECPASRAPPKLRIQS